MTRVLRSFEYLEPKTVEGAVQLLSIVLHGRKEAEYLFADTQPLQQSDSRNISFNSSQF